MSRAKTIDAIGEYDFFSPDYQSFIKAISKFFKVNFKVDFLFLINEETDYDKVCEVFNYGNKDTCSLRVCYFKFDEKKPVLNNLDCYYDLRIPFDFDCKEELNLQFYSTGIFQLNSLPFNSTWNFFIEDIIGLNDFYYKSHLELVRQVKAIRDEYIRILTKINCNEVIIMTDAYYQTESIIQEPEKINSKLTLKDVLKSLQEKDNLTLYNFAEAVNQKINIKDNHNSFLDIALYDNFNDKIIY